MLTEEDINKEILENPITKEEARIQWVEQTNKLGLKHAFTFDEAWEFALANRKKKEYRDRVVELERNVKMLDGALVDNDKDEFNPVNHFFAGGTYIREIFNPAGELIITKIHKKEHPFFLMQGSMNIMTEDGIVEVNAPHFGITKKGTKRVIYTKTDCVFITVHATELTDIDKIEDEVIAKDFNDPEISIEENKLLKNDYN